MAVRDRRDHRDIRGDPGRKARAASRVRKASRESQVRKASVAKRDCKASPAFRVKRGHAAR